MSEMPLPMPRWVISSPSHMTMTAPTVSVMHHQEAAQQSKAAHRRRTR